MALAREAVFRVYFCVEGISVAAPTVVHCPLCVGRPVCVCCPCMNDLPPWHFRILPLFLAYTDSMEGSFAYLFATRELVDSILIGRNSILDQSLLSPTKCRYDAIFSRSIAVFFCISSQSVLEGLVALELLVLIPVESC